jgi:hypothetical protein
MGNGELGMGNGEWGIGNWYKKLVDSFGCWVSFLYPTYTITVGWVQRSETQQ